MTPVIKTNIQQAIFETFKKSEGNKASAKDKTMSIDTKLEADLQIATVVPQNSSFIINGKLHQSYLHTPS